MTRTSLAVLLVVAPALLAGVAAGPARGATTMVKLPNGLRVVLAPDSTATAVDVATWFDAGVATASAAQAGVRPVAERLGYLGGADAPRLRALTSEGGIVGSATTEDGIVFWETMPAEALALALRVEAERMRPGPVSAAEFEAGRRSAQFEARRVAESPPLAAALARLGSAVLGDARAPSAAADARAIARTTLAGVTAWRSAHLTAGSAVLTIVGRFDAPATLAEVRRVFGPLPHGPATPAPPARAAGERRLHGTAPIDGELALVGWRVPGATSADAPGIELLAAVLGGDEGGGSRIDRALRVSGTGGINGRCGVSRSLRNSMFWVAASAPANEDSTYLTGLLEETVGILSRDTLSSAAVERERARMLTTDEFRTQDPHELARRFAETVFSGGDPADPPARAEALARLTPADLQRLASRLLVEGARTELRIVPEGGSR